MNGDPVRVAGAVLAAGAGARMGRPKATLEIDGRRLVDRAVDALASSGCAPIIAVVRAGTEVPGARVVINPDPGRGQRSSLELAVSATSECDAIAVVLVDTPGITAEAITRVVAAWRPGRIAVAAYGTRRGHPTVMAPADWWRAIDEAGPDEGARKFLASRSSLVDEIDVPGDPLDLDTPEDVARWRHIR